MQARDSQHAASSFPAGLPDVLQELALPLLILDLLVELVGLQEGLEVILGLLLGDRLSLQQEQQCSLVATQGMQAHAAVHLAWTSLASYRRYAREAVIGSKA